MVKKKKKKIKSIQSLLFLTFVFTSFRDGFTSIGLTFFRVLIELFTFNWLRCWLLFTFILLRRIHTFFKLHFLAKHCLAIQIHNALSRIQIFTLHLPIITLVVSFHIFQPLPKSL